MFGKKKETETVNPEDRSPRLGLKYKDLQVLNQLIKAGADLTKPRHVLFYLYFRTEEAAQAALSMAVESVLAMESELAAEIQEPGNHRPDTWLLFCQGHDIVVSPDFVRRADDLFQATADQHNGEYDGWEASV